jgi:formimidoylglutamate deiminase
MTILHADTALMPTGWQTDVKIKITQDGRIAVAPQNAQVTRRVSILLPAPSNLHSHGFQRAMAGLTERRGPDPRDSFWTWRQLMYRFLNHLTPQDIEAITAFVQMEMLQAGYAASGEFHYLHHQPGGVPYDALSELSQRIVAAAQTSGIGLTLLPVLYQTGGVDGRPLGDGQVRFGNDFDRFAKLFEGARRDLKALPGDANIGVAPHSLRAVTPDALRDLVDLQNGPIHMHLAEQVAEVDEINSAYGARPTEWLLNNAEVNQRWCLIHCTQMEPHETKTLAETGAVAGLCPITESSLGDGIFDGRGWTDNGGAYGIGSDSNIRISLSEELRTLEYSQRLRDKSRAVMATQSRSTARRLYDDICAGGAQAIGRESGSIAPGQWADLLALDGDAVDMIGRTQDTALDTWVFACDDRLVTDVWSAGRHLVQNGAHIRRAQITSNYTNTLRRLQDAL